MEMFHADVSGYSRAVGVHTHWLLWVWLLLELAVGIANLPAVVGVAVHGVGGGHLWKRRG